MASYHESNWGGPGRSIGVETDRLGYIYDTAEEWYEVARQAGGGYVRREGRSAEQHEEAMRWWAEDQAEQTRDALAASSGERPRRYAPYAAVITMTCSNGYETQTEVSVDTTVRADLRGVLSDHIRSTEDRERYQYRRDPDRRGVIADPHPSQGQRWTRYSIHVVDLDD